MLRHHLSCASRLSTTTNNVVRVGYSQIHSIRHNIIPSIYSSSSSFHHTVRSLHDGTNASVTGTGGSVPSASAASSSSTPSKSDPNRPQRIELEQRRRDFFALASSVGASSSSSSSSSSNLHHGSSTSETSPPPYPFTNSSEYAHFLDLLQQRLEYRFKDSSLVLGMMFQSSFHSYLHFFGSGLIRFYASHYAYQRYKYYDEGYLTRLKDLLISGLNLQDLHLSRSIGLDMSEPIRVLEEAQSRWHHQIQHQMDQSGMGSGGKQNRKKQHHHHTPATHTYETYSDSQTSSSSSSSPSSASSSSSSSFPRIGAPLSASDARAEFNRLMSSSSSPNFAPHVVWPCDLLQSALAAVYLDGGWPAADRLAQRTIGRQLIAIQRLMRHEFPNRSLGGTNWKDMLQPLVQRLYRVTPILETVGQETNNRCTVRVVIPPITITNRSNQQRSSSSSSAHGEYYTTDRSKWWKRLSSSSSTSPAPSSPASFSSSSSPSPSPLSRPSSSSPVVTRSLRSHAIVFPSFTGTRRIVEQRAAQEAYQQLKYDRFADEFYNKNDTNTTTMSSASPSTSMDGDENVVQHENDTNNTDNDNINSHTSESISSSSSSSSTSSSNDRNVSTLTSVSFGSMIDTSNLIPPHLLRATLHELVERAKNDTTRIDEEEEEEEDDEEEAKEEDDDAASSLVAVDDLPSRLHHLLSSMVRPESFHLLKPSEDPNSSLVEDEPSLESYENNDPNNIDGGATKVCPFEAMLKEVNRETMTTTTTTNEQIKQDEEEEGNRFVPSSSPSSSPTSSSSPRWSDSDYVALVDLLSSTRCWSLFPTLWSLLTDLDINLTRSLSFSLIDGFSHAGTLPLVIQTLRRLRQQKCVYVDEELIGRLLLACGRSSPRWGWQQTEKLLMELETKGTTSTFLPSSTPIASPSSSSSFTILSSSSSPSLLPFNAALWCCVVGYSDWLEHAVREKEKKDDSNRSETPSTITTNRNNHNHNSNDNNPNKLVGLQSPLIILKTSIRIRSKLNKYLTTVTPTATPTRKNVVGSPSHVAGDLSLTLALCGILDGFSGRFVEGWSCIQQLERQLGLKDTKPPCQERRTAERDMSSAHGTRTTSEYLSTVIDRPIERRHSIEFGQRTRPIIEATKRILERYQQNQALSGNKNGMATTTTPTTPIHIDLGGL